MSSIFSKIIKGEIPSYQVAEDDHYFAFLDIRPLQKGHVLVVPKVEVDYIFDLDDDTLSGLILFSKRVAKAIEASIPCERIGVAVIGLEVPHCHVHLAPINSIHDMNFAKVKEIPEAEMQEIASAIRSHFN
jgi:histidine triad (HIT) family protein